jgi:hypothetical protein
VAAQFLAAPLFTLPPLLGFSAHRLAPSKSKRYGIVYLIPATCPQSAGEKP